MPKKPRTILENAVIATVIVTTITTTAAEAAGDGISQTFRTSPSSPQRIFATQPTISASIPSFQFLPTKHQTLFTMVVFDGKTKTSVELPLKNSPNQSGLIPNNSLYVLISPIFFLNIFLGYYIYIAIPFQLQSEARAIGEMRHTRLVNLIGYCCDGDERLLVSEYMPNDTLTKHLFHCMISTKVNKKKNTFLLPSLLCCVCLRVFKVIEFLPFLVE